ncbi:MAG TPA: hypothetical protein VFR90_08450 [Methylibium sp.]|uniref:hypothetical protein n=1 Tax=Methylibium sp. TaxID=2067992 RepID=UPI002DBA2BE9|nr:hypothetical protein [Methylibium sp.]HEU4459136.1 hypothetical protein [Methylibium sp.]
MNLLDLLQWPAMLMAIAASWLVGSERKRRRQWGFWIFLASNVAWIAWAWHTNAPALLLLQVALAAMNIRGVKKADPHRHGGDRPREP